jgi:hypothetical protein
MIQGRIYSVIRNDNKFVKPLDAQSTYHVFEGYSINVGTVVPTHTVTSV